ncbi:MAG: hypothetical protein RR251_02530 [Hydrogenoanaerobacterium sp.]
MYYFRALSTIDMDNYEKKLPISAAEPVLPTSKEDMLCRISQHIKDGSNYKFAGCWISACKDFSICASEFSIPQSGKFNTATKRKNIAVLNSTNQYNDNFTYCKGIKNGKNLTLDTSGSFDYWNSEWKTLNYINEFVFDLSFPYKHNSKVDLQKYSYGDWVKAGFIKTKDGNANKGVPGIPSGNVIAANEILILNNIPYANIAKVLSLLEIDVLYALIKSNNDFNSCLGIICSEKFKTITKYSCSLQSYLYQELYENQKNLHELAYEIFKANGNQVTLGYDLLSIYAFLKDKKREIICSILNTNNFSCISPSSVMLLDDEIDIIVCDSNCTTYPSANISININCNQVSLKRLKILNNEIISKNKYDVLSVIDYNGNIINHMNQPNEKYFSTHLSQGTSVIVPISVK